MVEGEPDRTRIERAHERRVALELVAIALLFAIEERLAVRAFVRPRLEIDDPAHALRARTCGRRRCASTASPSHPASAHSLLASACAGSNSQRPRGSASMRLTAAVDLPLTAAASSASSTPAAASSAKPRRERRHARRIPRRDAVARDLREQAMRDGADVPRRLARPIERQRRPAADAVRRARLARQARGGGVDHAAGNRRKEARRAASAVGRSSAATGGGKRRRQAPARTSASAEPAGGAFHASAPSSLASGVEHAGEMQASLRARAADVEQPAELGAFLAVGEPLEIGVDRDPSRAPRAFIGASSRPRGRRRQRRISVAAAIGNAREPRQDHGIELEPLGAVQRHDLHARADARVGLRVQPRERVDERRPVGHVAGDLVRRRRARRNRSTASRSIGSVERRAAAEREPRAAHPRRNARAAARSRAPRRAPARRARGAPRPSGERPAIGSGACIKRGDRAVASRSAAATTAKRSGNRSPHQGARNTASQASRSAG